MPIGQAALSAAQNRRRPALPRSAGPGGARAERSVARPVSGTDVAGLVSLRSLRLPASGSLASALRVGCSVAAIELHLLGR
eukprot:1890118-Alexandrium_andersonii.AAC.1